MQQHMLDENIIIKEPSRNLRALGRNALSGKWKIAVITMCVYFLIQSVPSAIFDAVFGTNVLSSFLSNGDTYGMDAGTYAQILNNMPHYCALSAVYVILIAGALNLGLAIYALGIFRDETLHATDILLGFEKFGKALGLYIFQCIFVTLWSMLFIIPGIIAAIRYSQAFFILADDSSKGIRQCMNESKAMMRGNKSKFFCLGISFIGWLILSEIPAGIVGNIGETVSQNEFVVTIFSIAGSLFLAPIYAYMISTFAGFYEILAGHLIKDTMPVPVTTEDALQVYEEMNASQEESDEQ